MPQVKYQADRCLLHSLSDLLHGAWKGESRSEARLGRRVHDEHLSSFHSLVKGVSVGDINQMSAAMECRQRWECLGIWTFLKEQTKRRFDQLGHRTAPPCGFLLQARHHRAVDVQGGFHMDNHTAHTLECPPHRIAACRHQAAAIQHFVVLNSPGLSERLYSRCRMISE